MILGKSSKTAWDPWVCHGEDDEMVKAVLSLCYMKHAIVTNSRESVSIKRKEDQGDESIVNVEQGLPRCQQQLQHSCKRKALQIKEPEAIEVGKGLAYRQLQVPQDLFYGNYVPPSLPPVPGLQQFIEICSEPFEKQLTLSDVKDDQSRLTMSKQYVKKRLIPMLKENEDLSLGIQVTTYDSFGREYPMVFKTWVDKVHVLTSGWKTFCHDHKLVQLQDFVTVWMFRNAATGRLCFVIHSRRLPVFEPIKRIRTR